MNQETNDRGYIRRSINPMSRWNAADGLIHFLFANEDQYILESMIALDLTGYLNYELHRRHFQKILFVSGNHLSYKIRFFGKDSWDWAVDKMKGLLGLGAKNKEFNPDPRGDILNCSADQIRKLAALAENTAFVFALDSFAEIFKGFHDLLYNLQNKNMHQKNLMILRAGVTAEESQHLFQNPYGIFQTKTSQGYLFPEIISAFVDEDSEADGCYMRLKQLMGDRCVFLNRFSRGAVDRVVRYAAWIKKKEPLSDSETRRQVTEYIWKWYHDVQEQASGSGLLTENPLRSYQDLLRDVMRFGKTIEEVSEEPHVKEPVSEFLPEPGVISNYDYVRLVPDLPAYEKYDPERKKAFQAGCIRVRSRLRKPQSDRIPKESGQYLESCLGRMSSAVRAGDSGDYETFQRAHDAVCMMAQRHYKADEDSITLWQAYDLLASQSARLFEIQRTLDRDKSELDKVTEEVQEHIRNRGPVVSEKELLDMDPAKRAEIYAEEQRILKLAQKKEILEQLIQKNTQGAVTVSDCIWQAETVVKVLSQKQSEDSIEKARETLEKLHQKSMPDKADDSSGNTGYELEDLLNSGHF